MALQKTDSHKEKNSNRNNCSTAIRIETMLAIRIETTIAIEKMFLAIETED